MSVNKARLELAERVLAELYSGTMSSDKAKAQGKEKNRKARVRRNLAKITKKATDQVKKRIRGDSDSDTLSGGSRPWNKANEGMSTGDSPTQTGHRVGRFIGQKETDKAPDLPAKKRQAKRIAKRVAKRQADNYKKHNRPEDPDLVHDSAFERFKKNYYKGKAFTGPEKNVVAGPEMIKKLQPWRKR